MSAATRIGRRGRRRPARRRLPARRVDRPRELPRRAARQARARGGPGRRRQDRAREGAVALPGPQARAAAVLRGARRGQGAVRVELPQAAAADPGRGRRHRLGRRPGRHLRRGVPAQPPADAGDRHRRPGRAADRRDRQDRPGVRGDAARAAVGLPDHDPRARAGSRPARTRSCCSPPTTRASSPRRSSAAACTCGSTTRAPSTSWRSSACMRPSCPRRSRASSSSSSTRSATSTSRSRRRSPSRSTGRARCCCSAPTTSTSDVFRDTMSIIVKHRTDLDTVAERVGVRLGATA